MLEVYTMPVENWPYPNFSFDELCSSDERKVVYMAGVIDRLQAVRVEFGKAMPINSGCRSRWRNRQIGGARRSFHQYGAKAITGIEGACAFDVGTHKMTGGMDFYNYCQPIIKKYSWGAERWRQLKLAMERDAMETTAPLTDVQNLAMILLRHGWTIGVARNFLHIDRRSDYPETGFTDPLLFTYI